MYDNKIMDALVPSPEETVEAKVYILDQVQIQHYWPEIVKCLKDEPELWNRYFTIDGLLARAINEHMQVWVVCPKDQSDVIRIVLFTQILVSEVGKDLQVFWMWGNGALKALSCISLALDRFAEHCGCRCISVIGRPGWTRALKALGGDFEAVVIRRPVKKLKGH